jgi:hypothetical protein
MCICAYDGSTAGLMVCEARREVRKEDIIYIYIYIYIYTHSVCVNVFVCVQYTYGVHSEYVLLGGVAWARRHIYTYIYCVCVYVFVCCIRVWSKHWRFQNNWGLENSFERFLVRVYHWKLLKRNGFYYEFTTGNRWKAGNRPSIILKCQYGLFGARGAGIRLYE